MSPAKLSQCYTKKALKGLLKWTASRCQGDWCEWDKLIFGLGWQGSLRRKRGKEQLLCVCVCVCEYGVLLSWVDSNELWHLNDSLHALLSVLYSFILSFPNLPFSPLLMKNGLLPNFSWLLWPSKSIISKLPSRLYIQAFVLLILYIVTENMCYSVQYRQWQNIHNYDCNQSCRRAFKTLTSWI